MGYATPASVVQAWLGSTGHRANIENASYRTTGIGVAANAQGVYYWTQDFGTVSSPGGGSTTTPTTTTRTTTTMGTTTTASTGTTTTTATTGTTTTQATVPSSVGQAKAFTPVAHPRVERRRHYVLVHWKLKRHAARPAYYLVLWHHKRLAKTGRHTVRLSKQLHGRIRIVAVLPNGTREHALSVRLTTRR